MLEFQLTEGDFENFREQVGVNLNTNLKVRLGIGTEDASVGARNCSFASSFYWRPLFGSMLTLVSGLKLVVMISVLILL